MGVLVHGERERVCVCVCVWGGGGGGGGGEGVSSLVCAQGDCSEVVWGGFYVVWG